MQKILAIICTIVAFCGCNSSAGDKLGDAIDIVDGVPRKDINLSQVGVNCFFNDSRFGSIPAQFNEVTNTLGRRYIRVLLAWNDGVQSSPSAQPDFSFYDSILNAVPSGADALVVLTDVPNWMSNPANWIDNNPRSTFAELWVKKVVQRYGRSSRIIGWEIWNEPNMAGRRDNQILQLDSSPENFVELVAKSSSVAKQIAPGKFVVNGATTSINQNYPGSINYNEAMRNAGITAFIDVYNIHYYGKQFENVIRPGGVQDFARSIDRRIWITESGAQGSNEQLAYAEQVWPYLNDKIPTIDRIYYYQMYEATPSDSTYALRNLSAVSDLYVHLRGS